MLPFRRLPVTSVARSSHSQTSKSLGLCSSSTQLQLEFLVVVRIWRFCWSTSVSSSTRSIDRLPFVYLDPPDHIASSLIMGFAVRWLVSIALLVLPIAVTLGILLGIDGHRKATNQPPLFPPDRGDDQIAKHGTTLLTKCDKIGGFGGKAFKTEDRFICKYPKTLIQHIVASLPVDFSSSCPFSRPWPALYRDCSG